MSSSFRTFTLDGGTLSPDSSGALADPARLAAIDATGLLDAGPPSAGTPSAGTPSDDVPALNRVARLAARALAAPVAQINLVTAKAQIPRAAYVDPALAGDDPTAWRRPVSLAASLCQRVVQQGVPLVIDDARVDPFARESDAVTRGDSSAIAPSRCAYRARMATPTQSLVACASSTSRRATGRAPT